MAIDEADRQELMVARDIRTTLNMILDQLRLSGPAKPQKLDLTIAIDPATLTALAKIFGPPNVIGFKATFDKPLRSNEMANVKRFAAGAVTDQPMLDDQFTTVHWVAEGGAVVASQPIPVTSVDNPALATVDNTVDPTGMSAKVSGIKGQAGVATLTVSYMNADGTPATGTATVTLMLDPAELDVGGFSATFDAPQAQTPAAPATSRRP